ncbi:uncharacterized protein Tco025E_00690 [Trypanosoma conorhini]|uniref:Uncharacterized protein n=1 Tax=Trypanosoma conorhini TaxID=83891 RepID=A0A422QAP4_9TRYP|nr:uncharacterized protein Tco025E_00690 [Trypanosoma conorhini]RNF27053.1 hypothetical protein Tco025E_00690 [Trypanosoma conorhini]
MHAAVVTSVGLLVDAVIVERCIDENELLYETASSRSQLAPGWSRQDSLSQMASSFQTPRHSSAVSVLSGFLPPTSESSGNSYALFESVLNDTVYYECRATKRPLQQRYFHLFDVLPFGMESPSLVFGVTGRHTTRGLVVGVNSNGLFVVRPYATGAPLQLVPYGADRKSVRKEDLEAITKLSSSAAVTERSKEFMETVKRWSEESKKATSRDVNKDVFSQGRVDAGDNSSEGSSVGNDEVQEGLELWSLKDLQLPPQLALHDPISPLRVGSRVLARRYCSDGSLYVARVVAVHYDVTYTLEYESDGGVDERVLHNDIHLLDDSEAEQCSVRDKVTVALHKQLPAVIIECLGGEEYSVILEHNPNQSLTITRRHIVFIAPLLKEALYSDPHILQWFRDLDPTCSGLVPWKEVRYLIFGWESYGQKLSFQKLGEVQRDLCIHVGRMEPQLLRKVPVQEEEMLLNYAEFEYVILRVRNLL